MSERCVCVCVCVLILYIYIFIYIYIIIYIYRIMPSCSMRFDEMRKGIRAASLGSITHLRLLFDTRSKIH